MCLRSVCILDERDCRTLVGAGARVGRGVVAVGVGVVGVGVAVGVGVCVAVGVLVGARVGVLVGVGDGGMGVGVEVGIGVLVGFANSVAATLVETAISMACSTTIVWATIVWAICSGAGRQPMQSVMRRAIAGMVM